MTSEYFADTLLAGIKPGTTLTPVQVRLLVRILGGIISKVSERRDGILLTHDSLQNTIGGFLQYFGWDVAYEVPFETGGFNADRSRFDIVAGKGRRTFVVEVKDEVTPQALGQVQGYIATLKLSKTKAGVFLGTDLLNYGDLVQGETGSMVRDMFERLPFGIFLADKYVFVEFDNEDQLLLKEMPAIIVSGDEVE